MVFYLKISSPKIVAKNFLKQLKIVEIVKIVENFSNIFKKFDIFVILMMSLTRISTQFKIVEKLFLRSLFISCFQQCQSTVKYRVFKNYKFEFHIWSLRYYLFNEFTSMYEQIVSILKFTMNKLQSSNYNHNDQF